MHDVNFIAFEVRNTLRISGFVDTKIEYASSLQVELLTGVDSYSASVIRSVNIGINRYFQFSSVSREKGQNYYLRLKSSLNPQHYKYETPIVQVNMGKHTTLTVIFNYFNSTNIF